MNDTPDLITITRENINAYPGLSCFMNPGQAGVKTRIDWIRDRLSEGLTIRLLYHPGIRKTVGYIEYVPGEYAWRAVDAEGYLFIHCIWVYPKSARELGNGSMLVQACIDDAERVGKRGVAVIASDGPFMASKALFQKCGFSVVEEAPPSYSLLVYSQKNGPLPEFRDWKSRLSEYEGFHLLYANQCPWIARSVEEIRKIAPEFGLDLRITELKTAREAQDAPSVYGVFSLIYNGKLLADHYISSTRFRNIIRKTMPGKDKGGR